MKKPEEIKQGNKCCGSGSCDGCPYMYAEHDGKTCCDVLTEDTLALIQQFESQVPRWISVEERLPKRYEHVLVATRFADEGEQDFEIAYYAFDRWRKPEGMLYGRVTHWMPLPEPPKEDDHEKG